MQTPEQTYAEMIAALRRARMIAVGSQVTAAKRLGLLRTTLVAIEQGERRLLASELLAMMALYRLGVSFLDQYLLETEQWSAFKETQKSSPGAQKSTAANGESTPQPSGSSEPAESSKKSARDKPAGQKPSTNGKAKSKPRGKPAARKPAQRKGKRK